MSEPVTVEAGLRFPVGTQIVTRQVLCHDSATIRDDPRQSAIGGYPAHTAGVLIPLLPGDRPEMYRVRFPDGGELLLARQAFAPRKADRRAALDAALPQPGYDDLYRHVAFEAVVGSRAYGLDHEESDWDWRGCYVAPARTLWSIAGAPPEITQGERQYWEAAKFITLGLKANPTVLECLAAPNHKRTNYNRYGNDGQGDLIWGLGQRGVFLSALVYETFNGYAISQFQKLEQDRRNGRGWKRKHAMHLLRLLMAGTHLVTTGTLVVRLEADDPQRAILVATRDGDLTWEETNALRLEWHRNFERAMTTTVLPHRPNYAEAERVLLELRRQAAAHAVAYPDGALDVRGARR